MTATLTAPEPSAYPPAIESLMPAAIEFTRELGTVPSRNHLMKMFKIGAPKAMMLREALTDVAAPRPDTAPVPDEIPAPPVVVPDPAPVIPPVEPEPSPTEYEMPPPREALPLLSPVGHPGTEITADPPQAAADAAPAVPVLAPVVAEPDPAVAKAEVKRLRRLAMGTRAVFTLGVAASLAGNVLHAEGGYISQIISAWSPLALLLAVELLTRIPVSKGFASFVRLTATALIAGIAAWISYWHMAGVAAEYGESGSAAYLLPLSVDGLIVVASISLVEIGGRIGRLTGSRR